MPLPVSAVPNTTRARRGRSRGVPSMVAALGGVLLLGGQVAGLAGDDCVDETKPLAGMASREIAFIDDAGAERARLAVRVAASPAERAAGMQHLCPEAVADNPILFEFGEPLRPAFHMNNVHADLDIAFIDATGRVTEVRRMERGPRLTRPAAAVTHALELLAGQATDRGIEPGLQLVQ